MAEILTQQTPAQPGQPAAPEAGRGPQRGGYRGRRSDTRDESGFKETVVTIRSEERRVGKECRL